MAKPPPCKETERKCCDGSSSTAQVPAQSCSSFLCESEAYACLKDGSECQRIEF